MVSKGEQALTLIQDHIKDCSDNYRRLTLFVIGTLIASLGSTILVIINLALHTH